MGRSGQVAQALGGNAARGYIVVSRFYTARAGVALYCFERGGRRFSRKCVHTHSHNKPAMRRQCSVAPRCDLCRQCCVCHIVFNGEPVPLIAGILHAPAFSYSHEFYQLQVILCTSTCQSLRDLMCQHVYIAENEPPARC